MPLAIGTAFRPLVLSILIFIGNGCAATADRVSADFAPSKDEGLIYGRMEFVVNGRTLPPDARAGFVKPGITAHVSKYIDPGMLNKNGWKPGEFVFDAPVSSEGHFVGKLPVGKYYFVEFQYFGASTGRGNLASWRTYTETSGVRLRRPMLISFEVLPNKATYIGSLRHLVDLGSPSLTTQVFFFDLQLSNEFSNETPRLLQKYPHLKDATESHIVFTEWLDPQQLNK
jgi:hypothetical protein